MILVTTGTVSIPFRRLIDGVLAITQNLDEDLIIQAGVYQVATKNRHIHLINYIPLPKMIEYYQIADMIVSAGGEASILMILKYAKHQPIIFPRLKKYGEHVDDQQVETAIEFNLNGWVEMTTNISELSNILLSKIMKPNNFNKQANSKDLLVKKLIEFCEEK